MLSASARVASLASRTESSSASASSSGTYSAAARRRCAATTSRVTRAVTFGLPSRSPPIQLANTTGALSSGSARPHCARTTLSRRRTKPGTADQSDVSSTCRPSRASFCGVGLARRSSSLDHMPATSRRSAARAARARRSRRRRSARRPPRRRGPRPPRIGRRASRAAAWRSGVASSARRCTSVGCAVSTISTFCCTSASYALAGLRRRRARPRRACRSTSRRGAGGASGRLALGASAARTRAPAARRPPPHAVARLRRV